MLGRRAAQARAEQFVAASVLVGSGGVLHNAPDVPAESPRGFMRLPAAAATA